MPLPTMRAAQLGEASHPTVNIARKPRCAQTAFVSVYFLLGAAACASARVLGTILGMGGWAGGTPPAEGALFAEGAGPLAGAPEEKGEK